MSWRRGAAQVVMLLDAQVHISLSHFYSGGRSVVKRFNDIFFPELVGDLVFISFMLMQG